MIPSEQTRQFLKIAAVAAVKLSVNDAVEFPEIFFYTESKFFTLLLN